MSSSGPQQSPKILKFVPMAEQAFVVPGPQRETSGVVHHRTSSAQPFVPQRVQAQAASAPPAKPPAALEPASPPPVPAAPEPPVPLPSSGDEPAQQLLLEARQEAARLLAEAQAEVARWRQEAYQAGCLEGQQAAQAEWDSRLKQAAELMSGALRARETLLAQSEGDVIRLAMEIAGRIIRQEVAQDPQIVVGIAKEALKRLGSKTQVTIRLHPSELPVVQARLKELSSLARGVELVEDEQITPGGCLVEGNSGRVDARLETQMAAMEAGLLSAMDTT